MPTDSWGPAIDAREQLRRWDAGESIWSISMGGFGPGYEQAIQILAIEIVRDNLDKAMPAAGDVKAWHDWGMSTAERIDQKDENGRYACGGFSGAQVGAARNLAAAWLRRGPAAVHAEATEDRRILVSNFWPHVLPASSSTTPAPSAAK